MLSRLLTDWGHEVVITVDGGAAWDILRASERPQVAILDWMMPDIGRRGYLPPLAAASTGLSRSTYPAHRPRTGRKTWSRGWRAAPTTIWSNRSTGASSAHVRRGGADGALQDDLARRMRELQDALAQIHQLQQPAPNLQLLQKNPRRRELLAASRRVFVRSHGRAVQPRRVSRLLHASRLAIRGVRTRRSLKAAGPSSEPGGRTPTGREPDGLSPPARRVKRAFGRNSTSASRTPLRTIASSV